MHKATQNVEIKVV